MDFKHKMSSFSLFLAPFSVDVESVKEEMQLQVIDFQCDSVLQDSFKKVPLSKFYLKYLNEKHSQQSK